MSVEAPSYLTGQQWRLTAGGYVGFLPVTPGLGLELAPKAPVAAVFRMLDVAYGFGGFAALEGLFLGNSLPELYDRAARLLAERVLRRIRDGLYRTYVGEEDRLPAVRGRFLAAEHRPWRSRLPCRYEEHTPDVVENRLLAWALHIVLRSGICSEATLPAVRSAYRALLGVTRLEPYCGRDCAARVYHRLIEDYRPLHALCRFFFDHRGPSHRVGDRDMVPFVIDMAALFEAFVAEWLRRNLPGSLTLTSQETIHFGGEGEVDFRLDVSIGSAATGKRVAVLDTKYKLHGQPSSGDVEQVVAYAHGVGADHAVLVYPHPVPAFDVKIGDVHVRTIGFPLDVEPAAAGAPLLSCLSSLPPA